MPIKFLLKDGKCNVLTMSYDDGNYEGDKRLVGIFNKYGIKGTFHLNGHNYVEGGCLHDKLDELRELYSGHEISMHAFSHPWLERLPKSEVVDQLQRDREVLEKLAGYPVRGMSYPFGTYNQTVLDVLDVFDIKYSRTCKATNNFNFPENFTEWHPTTHHNGEIMELLDKMCSRKDCEIRLLYIWGHTHELLRENNVRTWEDIEQFCKKASEYDNIWYATNIEIYDYCQAMKRIEISYDRKMFVNPSAISVWVNCDGQTVELKPGVTKL